MIRVVRVTSQKRAIVRGSQETKRMDEAEGEGMDKPRESVGRWRCRERLQPEMVRERTQDHAGRPEA